MPFEEIEPHVEGIRWVEIVHHKEENKVTVAGPYCLTPDDTKLIRRDLTTLCEGHAVTEAHIESVLITLNILANLDVTNIDTWIRTANHDLLFTLKNTVEYNKDIAEAVGKWNGETTMSVFAVRARGYGQDKFPKLGEITKVHTGPRSLPESIEAWHGTRQMTKAFRIEGMVYTFLTKEAAIARAAMLVKQHADLLFHANEIPYDMQKEEVWDGMYCVQLRAIMDGAKNPISNRFHGRVLELVTVTEVILRPGQQSRNGRWDF